MTDALSKNLHMEDGTAESLHNESDSVKVLDRLLRLIKSVLRFVSLQHLQIRLIYLIIFLKEREK